MSNTVNVEVDVVERYDIIERKWKLDWTTPRSTTQLDVSVLVQGSIVADLLEEVQQRLQIQEVLDNQEPFDDPSVW